MVLAAEAALFAGTVGAYAASKPREPPVDLTKPVEGGHVDDSTPVALPDAYPHMALAPGSVTDRAGAALERLVHPLARNPADSGMITSVSQATQHAQRAQPQTAARSSASASGNAADGGSQRSNLDEVRYRYF